MGKTPAGRRRASTMRIPWWAWAWPAGAWLILLLLLATLSWQLLEKPLNSLKKRYPAAAEIGG